MRCMMVYSSSVQNDAASGQFGEGEGRQGEIERKNQLPCVNTLDTNDNPKSS